MPNVKTTPLELIKELETRLKEIGFIRESHVISRITMDDKARINKIRKSKNATANIELAAATSEEKKCIKWKRVAKKVFDPDLKKEITIIVDECVQREA